MASDDTGGVIGKEAGGAIKRRPSSIYWPGLRRWGILTFDGSLAQYHRSLDQYYLRVKGRRALTAENREATPEPTNWHAHIPPPPEEFPGGASMKLRPEEAEYLRERILSACSRSLLAFLADRGAIWDPVEFAWQHEGLADLPESLEQSLRHGQTFSEVMHGAALLYNVMLAQAVGSDAWLKQHASAFDLWAAKEHERSARLASWDVGEFWIVASREGARIPYSSRAFVEHWVRCIRGVSHPSALLDESAARDLIRAREKAIKPNRARLSSRRHLELWNGSSGAAQLNLRWPISQSLLLEILSALPRSRRRRHVA